MASSFPLKKNTAVTIVLPILDADGDLVTAAAALDSERSIDGAAFSDCTNEATEIGTTGIYTLALTAAETNGDVICIQVKTTTVGAKTTVLVFYTAAQTLDDTDVVVDAIKAKTDLIGASVALESGGNLATVLTEVQHATYGLAAIETLVDDLESRLTAARAGYLDELAAANIPADIDTLITRLTALRAGYLDNLSVGAVALEATLTAMKQKLAGTYNRETDSLEALSDSLSVASPTAAAISDAVWDELTADHVIAGSTSKALRDANELTLEAD